MEKPIDNGAAQFAADEIQRLEDRIKRLEEAGDAMAKRTYDEISRDVWRKAKEAKL
jgi:hypothetical protein